MRVRESQSKLDLACMQTASASGGGCADGGYVAVDAATAPAMRKQSGFNAAASPLADLFRACARQMMVALEAFVEMASHRAAGTAFILVLDGFEDVAVFPLNALDVRLALF